MTAASWVVTDAEMWHRLPWQHQREIRAWLRMNGIRPADVPVDSTVALVEATPGVWEIWHERFRRNENGTLMTDSGKPDEAYVRECAVPLEIDPPMHWLHEA